MKKMKFAKISKSPMGKIYRKYSKPKRKIKRKQVKIRRNKIEKINLTAMDFKKDSIFRAEQEIQIDMEQFDEFEIEKKM